MKNIFTLVLGLFLTACSLSSEYPLYKPSVNKPTSKITFEFNSAYGELGIYTFLNTDQCQVKRFLDRLKGKKKTSIKFLPSGQERAINLHYYYREGNSSAVLPIIIKLTPKSSHEYKVQTFFKKENKGIHMNWKVLEKHKNGKFKRITTKKYAFSLMPFGGDNNTWKYCEGNKVYK